MREDFLWVEKYRPKTVSDTVLPVSLKETFKTFVEQNNVPNLILSGTAGVGKTTIAKAMLEELGCDYIVINGSMNGNIDTLRTEIRNFASSVSFSGGRKYVILDEADYLNPQSTQPALRNFMEEYSSNCGFILTCNFLNRIIQPLHSRCSVVEFKLPKEEKSTLAAQMYKRSCNILETEGVEYDKKVVAEV
jgi:DNA polymerase III delta prime subunit